MVAVVVVVVVADCCAFSDPEDCKQDSSDDAKEDIVELSHLVASALSALRAVVRSRCPPVEQWSASLLLQLQAACQSWLRVVTSWSRHGCAWDPSGSADSDLARSPNVTWLEPLDRCLASLCRELSVVETACEAWMKECKIGHRGSASLAAADRRTLVNLAVKELLPDTWGALAQQHGAS